MTWRPPQVIGVVLHVISAAAVSYWSFSRHSAELFIGIDGANMLTMVGRQYAFTSLAFGFFANPLQGLSDIWFGFNAWFSPGYLVPHWILPHLAVADRTYHVAVYAAHVVILYVAILIFARAAAFSYTEALVGAWATVLLIFPFLGAPLVYPILQLQPNLSFSVAQALFILSAFSGIGRSGAPSWRSVLANGLLAVVALTLSMHLLLVSPTVIMLCLVFMVFVGAGFLFAALSLYEAMVKCGVVLLVAGVLVASGFATYLLGMFEFTAAKIFGSSLANDRMSFYFVSILFQRDVHGPAGLILAMLGIVGMVHASACAKRHTRIMSRTALALALSGLILGTLTVRYDFWRGPSPVYLEAMLWPLYALFGSRFVLILVDRGIGFAMRRQPRVTVGSPIVLVSMAAAPVLVLVLAAGLVTPQSQRAYVFPPSRPAMVDFLRQRIGATKEGSPLGRVAVFDLIARDEPASWPTLFSNAYQRMLRTGNDFATIGLWHFGIPTLFEYNPALSPALFGVTKTLFARPEDKHQRSVLVLRQPNPPALAALGIRYVITDAPTELPLVMTEDTGDNETLYLYEVPGAIEGAASPTNIETVDSFDAAVGTLGKPDFDPHTTAVAISTDVSGQDISELAQATNVSVRIVRERYRVTATSPGRSLLVIPVEFSRCLIWESAGAGGSTPTLLRINALETGIVFDRRIDGKFYYFTGPFTNSRCRIADAREFSNMLAQ